MFLKRCLMILTAACSCRFTPVDRGEAPRLRDGDRLAVRILLTSTFGEGVRTAAQDLVTAMARIAGVPVPADAITTDTLAVSGGPSISVTVTSLLTESLGDQGYRIAAGRLGGGSPALAILARSEIGAMYGLYRVARDLGVRYLHPRETFYPSNPDATLPWEAVGGDEAPAFARRGVHEHTEYPIPASDFLLNPSGPDSRAAATELLQWLARNRMNTLTFQLLERVDLGTWIPYIADVVAEAHRHGIRVGVVVSFVNPAAWRLIRSYRADSGANADQLVEGLDRLLDHVPADCPTCPACPDIVSDTGRTTGPPKRALFDFVVIRFEPADATRPRDAEVLSWLDGAATHLRETYCQRDGLAKAYRPDQPYPYAKVFAWVDGSCDLRTEDGGLYFHLPLRADATVGAFVHTNLFHDLDAPVPIPGCSGFQHQSRFIEEALGQGRGVIFFPSNASWRGLDVDIPLALPVTGLSREQDLRESLPSLAVRSGAGNLTARVTGHVVFSAGREWAYWQHDHYAAQAAWDPTLTWDAYLDWISEVYGERGRETMAAWKAWTDIQSRYLRSVRADLLAYLVGDPPGDDAENGVRCAARPALASIVEMSEAEAQEWERQDLEVLETMRDELRAVRDAMPEGSVAGTEQQRRLVQEVRDGMTVFLWRVEHAVALYRATAVVREWREEQICARSASPSRDPDPRVLEDARTRAEALLAQARAITEAVRDLVATAETRYRYPVEQVARERADSPTSFPYGYLYRASTAEYWSRRDQELQELVDRWLQEN